MTKEEYRKAFFAGRNYYHDLITDETKDSTISAFDKWYSKTVLLQAAVRSPFVLLTDLIDVIHYTIIKHRGENVIALEEIQGLEFLIKGSKELENYSVEETELWQSIMRQRN